MADDPTLDLFMSELRNCIENPTPPRPRPPIQQDAELRRVLSGIGGHVHSFLLARVGEQFHMGDLNSYVAARVEKCAPDSPRRVMGELKKQGWVEVELLSRSGSLYRVVSVEHRKETGDV